MSDPVSAEFGFRFEIPYLAGVYLAINGIRDCSLVVDGPMCAFYKIEQIQGNHEIVAELARLAAPHRIVHTELAINDAVMGEERSVVDKIVGVDNVGDAQAIYLTGLSSATLIGRDQERLAANFESPNGTPILPIRSRTLSGDYLDGWAETLAITAEMIPLVERSKSDKTRVGIVGHFYQRNEGDAEGDVLELERMVRTLGAEPVSVWLAGQSWSDLGKIGEADIIISLPFAERAAEILANRIDAKLVKLPWPFSWHYAKSFVEGLAEALDAQEEAEKFIESEIERYADSMLFLAEQHLLGSRWLLISDPIHLAGWMEIAADVGASIEASVITSRRHHLGGQTVTSSQGETLNVVFGAEPGWMTDAWRKMDDGKLDLAIANGLGFSLMSGAQLLFYEFGYPCYSRHPVVPTPTLGFAGQAVVVEGIAELFTRAKLQGHIPV